MKTRIIFTVSILMIFGISVIKSLNAYAQDDIYNTPSKNSVTNSKNKVIADTQGMTNYEKYRAMQETKVKKDNIYGKPDTTSSSDESAKQKGMARYGQGNVGDNNNENNENSDYPDNQTYSQQPDDSMQQGTTVINNYYGNYPDRFGWNHGFYFDYYNDPFYWDWGFSFGWPYWGFGFGWYSPYYYGYDPYFYGNYYGYGYYGHHDGYYYNHDGGYNHSSGGARRSMGGYRNPSDIRRSGLYGGQSQVYSSNRRSSTSVDKNGETYINTRRNNAYPLYQRTAGTGNSEAISTRRVNGNSSVYGRYKSVPTTRTFTNSRRSPSTMNKSYSPSYSTHGTSTRTQYNNSSNYNYSRRNSGYSSGTKSGSSSNSNYVAPRRSNESSSPSYSSSGNHSSSSGNSYTPSRRSSSSSGSSYSGSSGSSRSSGSSGSSSSGSSHSSSGSGSSSGGGGGHRR